MQSSAAAPMAACAEPGYMSVATPREMPPCALEQYSSMASMIFSFLQPVISATVSKSKSVQRSLYASNAVLHVMVEPSLSFTSTVPNICGWYVPSLSGPRANAFVTSPFSVSKYT